MPTLLLEANARAHAGGKLGAQRASASVSASASATTHLCAQLSSELAAATRVFVARDTRRLGGTAAQAQLDDPDPTILVAEERERVAQGRRSAEVDLAQCLSDVDASFTSLVSKAEEEQRGRWLSAGETFTVDVKRAHAAAAAAAAGNTKLAASLHGESLKALEADLASAKGEVKTSREERNTAEEAINQVRESERVRRMNDNSDNTHVSLFYLLLYSILI